MKRKNLIFLACLIVFCCGFNRLAAQGGDVTVIINEQTINQVALTFLDTKALNFSGYLSGWWGAVDYHITLENFSVNLSSNPQENVSVYASAYGLANLNILTFHWETDGNAAGTIYGGVEVVPEGTGYKLKFNGVGIRDFQISNVNWLIDLISGPTQAMINNLPEISFSTYVPLHPIVPEGIFTTTIPYMTVTDDAIYLYYNAEELRLGFANETGTQNYNYSYIEAGNNYSISNPGNVTLTSGDRGINLLPGFTANENSVFWAKIDPNADNMTLFSPSYYKQNKIVKITILDTAKTENIGKNIAANIPKEYNLHQNYPNPFNPSTTIKYDLKMDTKVTLVIIDILGREIKRIVDGYENAGYKSVTWDGTDNNGLQVSSGVYFYTLRAGSYVKTNRMIILK